MPTVLSLHLGGSSVHAAVSVDGQINVLALSDGQAYLQAPSPTDGPGLVRVLATAQARCVRIVNAVPDEVIVVRPHVGADDATLGEAAARARVPVPVVLDELRAVAALAAHGPAGIDRSLAPALGGLFWHRSGDAPTGPKPIVTRADLGVDASRDSRLPQAPSVVAVGPRTVFEQDAPRSTRGGGPPIPVLFVLAVLVVGAFIALIVMRSDDRPISQPPTVVTTSTVSSVTTTILPAETSTSLASAVDASTTTVAPDETSTTVAPVVDTSTTTLVAPVDTSTSVAPAVEASTTTVPHLGSVTLSGVGFTLHATTDTERLWAFGDDGGSALADLVTVTGEPVGDSGWAPDDRCTTTEVRRLGWGGLEVVLGREAADGPTLLAQWHLTGEDSDATSLWTLERIGIGSTVADLRSAHGNQISLERPSDLDPAGWFDTEPLLGDGIRGAVGNTSDSGRVLLMWAGEGCQRRFG